MSSRYSLSFGSQPSILPSYARIVFGRKEPVAPDGFQIPRLEAELRTYRPKRSRVEAYRAVCGGTPSDYLPVAYPHVIATPIQLALLSSIAFPVRLMGLVHLRNHIEHYRPIRMDETLALRTVVDGRRDTDRGQEFDVHTTVYVDNKPAWYEICVFMARRVERDTSKPFGARMFGFNQAIAHGMWSMARSLSALPGDTFDSACRVDVVFKRPVSIPAPLTLETWRTPQGDGFALKGAGKGKVHLAGSVTPLRTAAG
jgi:acyl dehydratase